MRRVSPDAPSLVAGIAVTALGALILAHQGGALELRFATLAPVACAVLGAILLAIGLSRGR